MFADDILLLSESAEGLQKSLDKLSEYCKKWQLPVNVKKTTFSMGFKYLNMENITLLPFLIILYG
jgi:hypothetical protein